MSDAERQKKRRAKLKSEFKKTIFVRGDEGSFDERILIALAVKKLADEGKLNDKTINLIAKTSETVFPETEGERRPYINKIVTEHLTINTRKDNE